MAGLIIKKRSPDEAASVEDAAPTLESYADDLINAVHNRDTAAASAAIRAAFECLENEPQENEQETTEDESE